MAHRLSLSKLTGKQPATQALPVMSFRYNRCDEDIQELQPMDTLRDPSANAAPTEQPPQPQPATLPPVGRKNERSRSVPAPLTQAGDRTTVTTGSRDSSLERVYSSAQSTDKKSAVALDLDVPDHPLAATSDGSSAPETASNVTASTEGRAQTADHAPAAVEPESAKVEASPVKESVKDYLSKFGKKSASSSTAAAATAAASEGPSATSHSATGTLAGSSAAADGTDGWFTGIKGRITKRLEERRHGTRLLRRDEDKSASTMASEVTGSHLDDEATTSVRMGGTQLDECREATERAEEAAATTRTVSSRATTVPFTTTTTTEDERLADPDLTSWEFIEQPERPFKHQQQAPFAPVPPSSFRVPSPSPFQRVPHLVAVVHALMSRNSILVSALVGVLALVLPMPAFSSGFIFGCVLSFLGFSFLWFLLVPTQPRFPFVVPDYRRMPALRVPLPPAGDSGRTDPPTYEGWMCQLPFESEYRIETHHMNNTKSVHLVLSGSTLRLRWPKHPVPRRAMWNEKRPEPVFISQRHISLADAKVMLLPEKLSRERLWNKKYPICLLIPSEDHHVRQANPADTQAPAGSDDELAGDAVKDLFVRHSARTGSTSTTTTATNTAVASQATTASAVKDDQAAAGNAGVSSKEPSLGKDSSATLAHKNGSVSKDAQLPGSASTRTVRVGKPEHDVLYLFARTCREKEEWFRRFQQAIVASSGEGRGKRAHFEDPAQQPPVTYEAYIAELQLRHREQLWASPCLVAPKGSAATPAALGSPQTNTVAQGVKSDTQWLNVLIGRLFYDVFTQEEWADRVRRRMQKKLSRIKVPFFMEELTVTDIHLGSQLPYVRRTSEAVVDKRGVWVDLDVTYNGAFYMTLSTKLNLMRLKRSQQQQQQQGAAEEMQSFAVNHEGSDDESAASSSDDEAAADKAEVSSAISRDPSSASGTGKKLLELVDKIAQSRYFQQATENRYIKRKMEEVSNTPLVLTVEVSHLVGTLALNIPPPPTDRIWYGFRTLPKMQLLARPKLGAKEVTLARVTERIEKMLFIEFQRIFVMPNMDDFMVPLMYSDITES
ncbi:testis-expressed protein 2 [Haemaphysalis longicornis]